MAGGRLSDRGKINCKTKGGVLWVIKFGYGRELGGKGGP